MLLMTTLERIPRTPPPLLIITVSFIIKSKNQLIFNVYENRISNILFNEKRFYQLILFYENENSDLNPTRRRYPHVIVMNVEHLMPKIYKMT